MDKSICVICITVATAVAIAKEKPLIDLADEQLPLFKEKSQGPVAIMTTGSGEPINYNDATSTLNKKLIYHSYFMESMTHFSRERIPERVVHAKGAGAFGHFEVTHDVTDICKAKLFSEVGKITPIAVRFSLVASERGGLDTSREARGFAVKFYTEEGNWDLLGLNLPAFEIMDPVLFPSIKHVQKKNPQTNLYDNNMFWDMFTLRPESLNNLMYMYSDGGIPDGYRHMPGFPIHTYQIVNRLEKSFFVRFHFLPDAGIRNLFSVEARKIGGEDPDYATRDLYNAIAQENFPTWTIYIQVLTIDDVHNSKFDVFDISQILPDNEYPLRPVGRLVLNKNPVNYFADIEQLAYNPGNLVSGILGSPDKVFEGRILSYRDAQTYRLGPNFFNIPVNCPINNNAYTYNRDGHPPVGDNGRDTPNYYPNSFNGPVPYLESNRSKLIEIYQHQPYSLHQVRAQYFSYAPDERKRLVDNIVSSLKLTTTYLQERAVKLFRLIDAKFGEKVFDSLKSNRSCPEDL